MRAAKNFLALSFAFVLTVGILLINAPELYGQNAQANLALSVMETFVNRTSSWWGILQPIAMGIFSLAVKLEIALLGIRMVLQRSSLDEILGQFVTLIFYCFIIYLIIMKYQEWANVIAITGLKELGTTLSGGGTTVDPGTPIDVAMTLGGKVMDTVSGFSLPTTVFMNGVLVALFIIMVVIFVLISALYIITVCEFHIVANVGVLLIGLGGSRTMKDYAINVMRYILSVGI